MSNIASTPASMCQFMAIFAVGLALAFVGCGSDEPSTPAPSAVTNAETIIDVDGHQVVVLEGRVTADKTLSATYDYLLRGAVFVEGGQR